MPSSACKTCALRSEEHTSELQSHDNLVCRLLLETKDSRHLFSHQGIPGRAHGDTTPSRGVLRDVAVRVQMAYGRAGKNEAREPASRFFLKDARAPKRAVMAHLNATGV